VLVYDEAGEEREESVVLNFFMDCRDAMGANMVLSSTSSLLLLHLELSDLKVYEP